MKAALWYIRHGCQEVTIHDDEDDAADDAEYMGSYGYASVVGVQLEGGSAYAANDWPALQALEKKAGQEQAERPPPLRREWVAVNSPFDGKPTRVDASLPDWVKNA